MNPDFDRLQWRGGVGVEKPRPTTPEAIERMRERAAGFGLFDAAEYLSLSPDLEGQDGLGHFAEYGVWESHRPFAGEKAIASALGALAPETLPRPRTPDAEDLAGIIQAANASRMAIHVNSRSQYFVRALAESLVEGLAAIGVRAELLDETGQRDGDRTRLFVAPHQFFTLGRGAEWATAAMLSSNAVYNTVPVHAAEFRAALPFVLLAKGIVDPSPHNCALFEASGFSARLHIPTAPWAPAEMAAPPDDPLVRGLSRAARTYEARHDIWSDRPIDLLFMGSDTAVRDEFFGHNAGFLADLSCVIHLVRLLGRSSVHRRGDTRPPLDRWLARRSKIVLSLARDDLADVDWRRMILGGFARKALVVSTPCLPHPLFKPGVHYLEESWRRLPKLIDWLLHTPEGNILAERVRAEAYATLMERAPPQAMAALLADFLVGQGT